MYIYIYEYKPILLLGPRLTRRPRAASPCSILFLSSWSACRVNPIYIYIYKYRKKDR